MNNGEGKRPAFRIASLHFVVTLAALLIANYFVLSFLEQQAWNKITTSVFVVASAFATTAIIFLIYRKKMQQMSHVLKEYSERKDSYQELYLNFNKINKELHLNNQKLKDTNIKLEEIDNLKNTFLSNMSHEIRTPMNSIIGFSDLICLDDVELDKKRKYIRIIKSNSKQLLKIVNDILDISKLENNQIRISSIAFDLNKFIDDCLIHVHELTGINNKEIIIRFSKGLKDGEDRIYADRNHLFQVLTNLLDNSVKFTKSGKVDIGYKLSENSRFIEFFVRDTGKGIATDMTEIIFERFRQEQESTTRNYGGTGLGLPIAKGITDLMGGRIWCESTIDVGSTFFVQIPYRKITSQLPITDMELNLPKESKSSKGIYLHR
jgi:signal transduction histidine kinase